LRYTNIALAHIRNSPHKAIDQHYALVHEKNNITYVNIFTSKPFGKYYRISNNGINPKYNSFQYLQDQTYIVELQKRAEADFYLDYSNDLFLDPNEFAEKIKVNNIIFGYVLSSMFCYLALHNFLFTNSLYSDFFIKKWLEKQPNV
jgi:hypothetical protein